MSIPDLRVISRAILHCNLELEHSQALEKSRHFGAILPRQLRINITGKTVASVFTKPECDFSEMSRSFTAKSSTV